MASLCRLAPFARSAPSAASLSARRVRPTSSRFLSSTAPSFASSAGAPAGQAATASLASSPSIPVQESRERRAKAAASYTVTIDTSKPVGDFLSQDTVSRVAEAYPAYLMHELCRLTLSSELEHASVLDIVTKVSEDTSEYWRRAWDLAANALNHNFFLSSLRDTSLPGEYPYLIEKHVVASFGSNTGLEQTLIGTAEGMSSSGWIWLVQEARSGATADEGLAVIATYGSGTLLVHDNKPVDPTYLRMGLDTSGYIHLEQRYNDRLPQRPAPLPRQADLFGQGLAGDLFRPGQGSSASGLYPLACLNLNEACYMHDHGVWGKEAYVKAWLRALDWNKVEKRMWKGAAGGSMVDGRRMMQAQDLGRKPGFF